MGVKRAGNSLDRYGIEYISYKIDVQYPLSQIENWKLFKHVIALIAAWASAVLCARFYTGRGLVEVLRGMRGGDAAYNSYQVYFENSNLSSFSFAKIPYIFMLAYLTIILIWSMLAILLCKEKIKWWKKIYLLGVIAAYLFFGASRGTNFETYIVFIMFAYCLLHRVGNIFRVKSFKYFLLVIVAGFILIFIFRARILDRGVEFQNEICPEIQFCSYSFIAKVFPTLTNIGLSVFGYLGYGIYCIGVAIDDIIANSATNVLASVFPFGFPALTDESLGAILGKTINMGVKWAPDFVNIINCTGVIGYFITIYLLGRFSGKVEQLAVPDLLRHVLQAVVFIELLSIPVGNFLLASSSNVIMVLFALLWWIQFSRLRIRIISISHKNIN